MTDEYLYKVLPKKHWEACRRDKYVKKMAIDNEFIHLAHAEQVPHVLEKFFSDNSDIVILQLDPAKLEGRLIKERNPGGQTEYFHLYDGAIPLTAVVDVDERLDFFAGI